MYIVYVSCIHVVVDDVYDGSSTLEIFQITAYDPFHLEKFYTSHFVKTIWLVNIDEIHETLIVLTNMYIGPIDK